MWARRVRHFPREKRAVFAANGPACLVLNPHGPLICRGKLPLDRRLNEAAELVARRVLIEHNLRLTRSVTRTLAGFVTRRAAGAAANSPAISAKDRGVLAEAAGVVVAIPTANDCHGHPSARRLSLRQISHKSPSRRRLFG